MLFNIDIFSIEVQATVILQHILCIKKYGIIISLIIIQ